MSSKKRSDVELWKAFEDVSDDALDPALPRELLDQMLSAAGVDPAELRKRGADVVLQLQEKQRMAWQEDARRQRDALNQRAKNIVVPVDTPRDELLRRLDDLRRNPSLGAPIMTAFRKRKAEESSNEDLRILLESVEELRAMQTKKEDDGEK